MEENEGVDNGLGQTQKKTAKRICQANESKPKIKEE
jgi:hypothetical protein